jgi:hypothetical protein
MAYGELSMSLFGKSTGEHATKADLAAHQVGDSQRLESLNVVCVDTREMIKSVRDMLAVKLEELDHRVNCVEQDICVLKTRVGSIEKWINQ